VRIASQNKCIPVTLDTRATHSELLTKIRAITKNSDELSLSCDGRKVWDVSKLRQNATILATGSLLGGVEDESTTPPERGPRIDGDGAEVVLKDMYMLFEVDIEIGRGDNGE
jgi:hypothetical protein